MFETVLSETVFYPFPTNVPFNILISLGILAFLGVTPDSAETRPVLAPVFLPPYQQTLDIFEAPVTVTPQQKISKTLNSILPNFPKNTQYLRLGR